MGKFVFGLLLSLLQVAVASAVQVAQPVFSEPSTSSAVEFEVNVTCGTDQASIRYTDDGSEPTESSRLVVNGRIQIDRTKTVKVRAFKVGFEGSDTATATFEVTGEVSVDGNTGMMLRSDGTVWLWGSFVGKISVDPNATYISGAMIQADLLPLSVQVSAAEGAYFALAKDGVIWSWQWAGSQLSSADALLGRTVGVPTVPSPVIMPRDTANTRQAKFVQISAGCGDHAAAVTEEGRAYVWGNSAEGGLGSGTTNSLNVPTLVRCPYSLF